MQFQDLIQARRSVRSYIADTQISDETLQELLSAVQLAPTWKNRQAGHYYIARTPEMVEKVRAALPAFNQKSAANAPVLIVTTFEKGVSGFTAGTSDNEPGDEWGAYDLGLQNAYLVLKASDLGLDTLIMGLRDANALRSLLNIPETEELMAVIAVGKHEGDIVFRPRKANEDIAAFF